MRVTHRFDFVNLYFANTTHCFMRRFFREFEFKVWVCKKEKASLVCEGSLWG